jgi:hypothetical protein
MTCSSLRREFGGLATREHLSRIFDAVLILSE